MSFQSGFMPEQRYWNGTQFSGLNGNYLYFVGELVKEMEVQKKKLRENTRGAKIVERAGKYLEIIYNLSLSSAEEIQNCRQIREYREIIRRIPLPTKNGFEKERKPKIQVTRVNSQGQEYQVDIDSDYETELPMDHPGFPKGWFVSEGEREVSAYMKLVIDSAVCGPAKEVITTMGSHRDRNGFETIEKLADTYGRFASDIAMAPMNFVWGNNDRTLAQDWVEYKIFLDGMDYLRLHPHSENFMVNCALRGFEQYTNSYRILDHIRVTAGENTSWEKLKRCVDTFLGNSHRTQFQRALLNNDNGLAAMTTAAVLKPTENAEYINYVNSPFKSIGNNKKGKGKGKNNQKSASNNKNSNSNSSGKANQSSQKKSNNNQNKRCAWCSDQNHTTNECKSFGNGKWSDKQCNRCRGYGHPQSLCITPPKKKDK